MEQNNKHPKGRTTYEVDAHQTPHPGPFPETHMESWQTNEPLTLGLFDFEALRDLRPRASDSWKPTWKPFG